MGRTKKLNTVCNPHVYLLRRGRMDGPNGDSRL